jgi:hypothetical protein
LGFFPTVFKGSLEKEVNSMTFEFTDEEKKIVRHALETYVSELRAEIVKTEKHEWKEGLHHEKDVIGGVMERLAA